MAFRQGKVSCAILDGQALWQGVLTSLETFLKELGNRHVNVTLVLSNHFVRYAVVRWENQLKSESEHRAYARHQFTRVYGDMAEQWDIRISNCGRGSSRLASAVDTEMTAQIGALFTKNRVRLDSLQPLFMMAFNYWRPQLHERTFLIGLAEVDRVCLAKINEGEWTSLRNQSIRESIEDTLANLLRQEILFREDDQEVPLYLYATGARKLTLPLDSAWALHYLDVQTNHRSEGGESLALLAAQ